MKGNRKHNTWTVEEEIALLNGIKKHGVGNWKKIRQDPKFADQLVDRTNIDLKDKWRNIEKTESESQTLESASVSSDSNDSSPSSSSSDMNNESRYDDAISSDENGSDLSEIKEKSETQTLESVSTSPAMTSSSPYSSSDMNSESRPGRLPFASYASMVFEALSTINDEDGSRLSEILSFIEERHEVPQNFRELLIYILIILVSDRKLKKVRKRYKISITKATKPKLTLHPKDSAMSPELPSTSAILTTSKETQEIDAVANKIAEGIDKLAEKNMVLYEETQFRELVSDCLKILVSEGKLEKVLDGYTISELVNKVLEVAPGVVAERVAEADNERSIAVEAVEEAERLVEESEISLSLSLALFFVGVFGKECFYREELY